MALNSIDPLKQQNHIDLFEMMLEIGYQEPYSLGRDSRCTFRLHNSRTPLLVSRQHATIRYESASCRFVLCEPVQTTNGTYVNEVRVDSGEAVPMNIGDIVSFGGPEKVIREGVSIVNPFRYKFEIPKEEIVKSLIEEVCGRNAQAARVSSAGSVGNAAKEILRFVGRHNPTIQAATAAWIRGITGLGSPAASRGQSEQGVRETGGQLRGGALQSTISHQTEKPPRDMSGVGEEAVAAGKRKRRSGEKEKEEEEEEGSRRETKASKRAGDGLKEADQAEAGCSGASVSRARTEEAKLELTCCICHEVMVEAHLLPSCSHSFCGPCIHQWLTTKHTKASCPSCRAPCGPDNHLGPVKQPALDQMIKLMLEPSMGSKELAARKERREEFEKQPKFNTHQTSGPGRGSGHVQISFRGRSHGGATEFIAGGNRLPQREILQAMLRESQIRGIQIRHNPTDRGAPQGEGRRAGDHQQQRQQQMRQQLQRHIHRLEYLEQRQQHPQQRQQRQRQQYRQQQPQPHSLEQTRRVFISRGLAQVPAAQALEALPNQSEAISNVPLVDLTSPQSP